MQDLGISNQACCHVSRSGATLHSQAEGTELQQFQVLSVLVLWPLCLQFSLPSALNCFAAQKNDIPMSLTILTVLKPQDFGGRGMLGAWRGRRLDDCLTKGGRRQAF